MVVNLKIQGNFLILSDTVSLEELLCSKRSEIIPKKNIVVDDPNPIEYFYNFLSTTYTSGGYKTQNSNGIEFNDFIDDRTGVKFTSVDELDEFLRLNLGGNNAPVQVLKYTGWEFYKDAQYTEVSPLTINNSNTQVTIDGLAPETNTSQSPADAVNPLWDTTNDKIIPISEGDSYSMRFSFVGKSNKNTYFTVKLDIGTGGTPIIISSETKISPNTSLVPTRYSFDIPIFCLSTFISNGGKLYIDNTDDASTMDAYEFEIFVGRLHKA